MGALGGVGAIGSKGVDSFPEGGGKLSLLHKKWLSSSLEGGGGGKKGG